MVVSGSVLAACYCGARSGHRKRVRGIEARDCSRLTIAIASFVAGGDPASVAGLVARLHGAEPARLFALLHLHQAGLDSTDRGRLRNILFQERAGLAHRHCRNVLRPARPALCLLQRWKRMVDRSLRCKPALLRLGFRRERHSSECFAKRRSFSAFASFMFHSHLRRDRVLRRSSLFSVPLVSEHCRNSGSLNRIFLEDC